MWLRAAPLVVAHAGLLATFDLAARPLLLYLWLVLATGGLVWAVGGLERSARLSAASVLLVAALLRLLLVPLPPTLSDDLLRYLWDGKVAAAGLNPYELAPDSAELAPLRDADWRRLPHRHVPTVYPPLAVTVFSIAARLPWPAVALKLGLVAADLLACWLLLGLAAARGLGRWRVLWYAWNPLVTLELAGMGHVDGLGVAASVAVVAWIGGVRRRPFAAAATAAAAVLVKLVPLAALPAWSRQSGRPWLFAAATLALVVAAAAPVVVAVGGVPPGLVTYGVSWEFNGPLFEPLWRLLDGAGARGWVESRLDALKQLTGNHDLWNRFYPFNYPQLQAKLLLAPGLVAVVALAWRRRDPLASAGVLFGGLPLFSATVYPWYLLWALPWAALCRQRAWLALAAVAPLSYLPKVAGVPLWPWVWAAVWLPFLAALLLDRRWSTG